MEDDSLPTPLPLQFQLLYNWEASAKHDALLKNKTRMYPAFKVELNQVPIYRLIDYEFETHYISAGQLWKACGLTTTEGLFLFKLKHSDYEVDFLVPNFPFCDIWVDLARARAMASTLGVDVELQPFLEEMPVFSSDNPPRSEIVHNWKVESIPDASYSTRALLESEFTAVDPLPNNQKIRTQISRAKQPGLTMKDRLETGLTRWQIAAYERFLEEEETKDSQEKQEQVQEQQQQQAMGEWIDHLREEHDATWDVLQGLLCDLQTILREGTDLRESRVLSDNMMVGNMALKREYLGQSRSVQHVYLAVMAEKIYNEIGLVAKKSSSNDKRKGADPILYGASAASASASGPIPTSERLVGTHHNHVSSSMIKEKQKPQPGSSTLSSKSETDHAVEGDPQMMLHDRMDALEQELYRTKRRMRKKSDSMHLKQQELQHQITALETWKARNERSRKSERVWMLMLMLSIFTTTTPTDVMELYSKKTDGDVVHLEESRVMSSSHARHHKRTSSTSSFVLYRAPTLPTDEENDKTPVSHVKDAHRLATQALPSLLISVIGLVFAGWMMDIYQHWQVFVQVSELFILVPVLLNLKGNLEMNLAARCSTSAHLGDLDHPQSRNALVWGNLALIQVQALIAGSIAGVFSFFLGILQHPSAPTTVSESILVITSSMISAAVSSFVLGVFMCALIILSRKYRIDPDNIACPMAASLGDVVTLGVLAGCAQLLLVHLDSMLSLWFLVAMIISLPFFAKAVWKNIYVKDLLYSGWTPIILAMLISSFAGLVLERYVEQYKGLAMLTPILCGLAGNLGSIYASRISTCLHAGKQENYKQVEWTLLLMNVPVQWVFLYLIWLFDLGHLDFNFAFCITYFIVAMLCTWLALKMGKSMTLMFWKSGYDPDNYVLPYLTAVIDVVCTSLLVISFSWLTNRGYADLAYSATEQGTPYLS
ncbi:hypothetical protein EC973_005364 [Apophysomyces ossiformis]|uniref:SLC41A/MgtE integral membrane domain-containing protein n=1 Tax=Apophysomyces ossiformis TaxID=679940 RepID=A0A8H7EM35_9FUNG|nr:hypothetical protein EC973_005364 [Apophysomyces ossiformis]